MGLKSGVYRVKISGMELQAYCDIDRPNGQTWLVIQQRGRGGHEDFYR